MKRYVTMEVAENTWVEWSVDPWDTPDDGYVAIMDGDKEYWEIEEMAVKRYGELKK